MELNTVAQIEQAIDLLTPPQVDELSEWLERRRGQLLDDRVELDLAAGRLDSALDRAISDKAAGRLRAL